MKIFQRRCGAVPGHIVLLAFELWYERGRIMFSNVFLSLWICREGETVEL